MAERDDQDKAANPALDMIAAWSTALLNAQKLLLETSEKALGGNGDAAAPGPGEALMAAQAAMWRDGMAAWQAMLGAPEATPPTDRRFAAPAWTSHPMYEQLSKAYLLGAERLRETVETLEGIGPKERERLRLAARAAIDALSPANFPLANPEVIEATIASNGANLALGMQRMMADLERGQLTQVDETAFEVGRNIAVTPGKVIRETPLYQLIHYAPATPRVDATPLLIFPAWINRYYILDLNPANSFVRWAVEQGLSVFVVSWRSADAGMAGVTLDDYVIRGQADAIDAVREALGVEAVHALGYCVAGTTLAATLAWLAARGEGHKVKSATFLTAQVDFSEAGDLGLLVDDAQIGLVEALTASTGYLDGRFMAATFNMLRGRDLIWSYVVNNYLLARDYPAFDLLYWNSDTTNLPAAWLLAYLRDLYRDNLLATPGGISVGGVPIDLGRIVTPSYVQAAREDHIAPPQSVWKTAQALGGAARFVLAGSGHIAGVINPPAAGKYQYWTLDAGAESFEGFVAGARESKGSWWPDWRHWLHGIDARTVAAKGARIPGKGPLAALEDAPGGYVRR